MKRRRRSDAAGRTIAPMPITIDSREILELIRTSIYPTTMARTCATAGMARQPSSLRADANAPACILYYTLCIVHVGTVFQHCCKTRITKHPGSTSLTSYLFLRFFFSLLRLLTSFSPSRYIPFILSDLMLLFLH